LKSEESIKVLTGLGLTIDQARVYLALVYLGSATAKQLSEESKIAKPDIYRIIPTLQKQGMVETLMSRPASFKAIPSNQSLHTLLERKATEQNELRRKTEALLSSLEKNHVRIETNQPSIDFAIIPGKEVIIQKLKESLLKAQISLCVVTSKNRFSASIREFADAYRKALRKGVKIRIAAEQIAQTKTLEIVQILSRDPHFEVKYFKDPPPAIVTIFDAKEAYLTLSETAQLDSTSAIRSNNLGFTALAQAYFENKWNNET
jgi:sugar-specific transcriptional regulator TrmB